MALDDVIRAAVATAKTAVQDLLVPVLHKPVIGHDQDGPVYAESWIERDALVEDVGEAVMDGGVQSLATSKLTFLEPIGVGMGDLFKVDGVEMEVAQRQGLLDAGSNPRRTFLSEVFVGRLRR